MAHYKGAANEATRAMHIMKKRERAREELELKKKKVEEDVKLSTIDNKFATHNDAIESQLKSSTVGLVTLEQMRQRQETAVKEREKQLAHKEKDSTMQLKEDDKSDKDLPTKQIKTLSYDDEDGEEDDDEDEDNNVDSQETTVKKDNGDKRSECVLSEDDSSRSSMKESKKAKLSLPAVDIDTSFLPDKEREEEERILREKLASEWRERQQKLKEEEIEITFSFWDGSGHRRVVRMKKGNSIYQFLQACLETLRKDFNELRTISADHLMYIKEDLIIPHHYTFYDFIVTKARGKSGPLFSFDVHDDIRLVSDVTVEKDESHAGKVLLRSWYERNKHIFPASRWEPYDPTKNYEKYTISDKKSSK